MAEAWGRMGIRGCRVYTIEIELPRGDCQTKRSRGRAGRNPWQVQTSRSAPMATGPPLCRAPAKAPKAQCVRLIPTVIENDRSPPPAPPPRPTTNLTNEIGQDWWPKREGGAGAGGRLQWFLRTREITTLQKQYLSNSGLQRVLRKTGVIGPDARGPGELSHCFCAGWAGASEPSCEPCCGPFGRPFKHR